MRRRAHSLEARVRRAAGHALAGAGYPPDAADIFFAADREMRMLKAKTTGTRVRMVDVLAFEAPEGFPHPEKKICLGEVYVNAERYRGRPERILFLVIHGLAHLLGFRHASPRDTMKMRRVEKNLLAHAHEVF